MERKNSSICLGCYMEYNIDKKELRYIGCKNQHMICNGCLHGQLHSQISDNKLCCPEDNFTVSLLNKKMEDFPEAFVGDVCVDHIRQAPAEVFCLTCSKKICKPCRQNHIGHSTIFIIDFPTKKQEVTHSLQDQVEKVKKMRLNRDEAIRKVKSEKIQAIDLEFEKIIKKVEEMKQKVKDNLKKAIEEFMNKSSDAIKTDKDLNEWDNYVKKKFDALSGQNKKKEEEVLLELFKIEGHANKLTPKLSQGLKSLETTFNDKMKDISFNFADRIFEPGETKVLLSEYSLISHKEANVQKKEQEPIQPEESKNLLI